jgi:hypothetical protein
MILLEAIEGYIMLFARCESLKPYQKIVEVGVLALFARRNVGEKDH